MERVLFVHAHPDDESILTGGTIATLIARGAAVTVLTCTRGERGAVVADAASADGPGRDDQRERELAAALAELGVTDHRWLGDANARWADREPRRYEDSGSARDAGGAGRAWQPPPGSLTAADPGEVAADIAAVIAAVGPHVVVSHDARGGAGHPDHVRAHDAARTAADVFEVPFYAIVDGPAASGTMRMDVTPVLARKRAAMAAHRSRLTPAPDGGFTRADGTPQPVTAVETFTRVRDRAPTFAGSSLATRVGSCAVALLLGVFGGALLTFVHQASVEVAGVPVPWGIVAALVIAVCLILGLRLVFGTRVVASFAAIGMIGAVTALSIQSAGGSLVVPGNPLGYVWVFAPVVIAIAVLAWPRSGVRRAGRIDSVRVEGQEQP